MGGEEEEESTLMSNRLPLGVNASAMLPTIDLLQRSTTALSMVVVVVIRNRTFNRTLQKKLGAMYHTWMLYLPSTYCTVRRT